MRRLVAIAACALLASGAQAGERERTDAPPLEPYKIIIVGDSPLAPPSEWGEALRAHHVNSSVACINGGGCGRPKRRDRHDGGRGARQRRSGETGSGNG